MQKKEITSGNKFLFGWVKTLITVETALSTLQLFRSKTSFYSKSFFIILLQPSLVLQLEKKKKKENTVFYVIVSSLLLPLANIDQDPTCNTEREKD